MALWVRAGHIAERNVEGKRFLVNALRRRHSAVQVGEGSAGRANSFDVWERFHGGHVHATMLAGRFPSERFENFREGRVGGDSTYAYVRQRAGAHLGRPGTRLPSSPSRAPGASPARASPTGGRQPTAPRSRLRRRAPGPHRAQGWLGFVAGLLDELRPDRPLPCWPRTSTGGRCRRRRRPAPLLRAWTADSPGDTWTPSACRLCTFYPGLGPSASESCSQLLWWPALLTRTNSSC
jgi:hypothetical protein